MPARDLVVRTQELGGRLVAIGGDHARGIVLEDTTLQADGWGSSAGSLVLKRDPRRQWPDLQAYAPVKIECQGVPVWLGRIKNTPMTDGGIARQIALDVEGKQFHLDDDLYTRTYVHTNVADWIDIRAHPGAVLGATNMAATPNVATGTLASLTWPSGVPIPGGAAMGIVLDLGPGNSAISFSVWSQSSANSANDLLYIRGYNVPSFGPGVTPFGTAFEGGANNTYFAGFINGTFTAPCRYVAIYSYCSSGYTPVADVWWRFPQIDIFTDTAYQQTVLPSGTASYSASIDGSILKASDIVSDALNKATLLLSTDRSLIVPTSFSIPEFAMSGPQTARGAIGNANIYHGWQSRIRVDNRPEFRPLPATPSVEVGDDCQFAEASAGDGSEVYTGVIVEYTDGNGVAQRIYRSQPADLELVSATQPSNPSFVTNTAGWVASYGYGSIARDTGVFDTSPASLKVTYAALPGPYYYAVPTLTTWTGGFTPGRPYVLTMRIRSDLPFLYWQQLQILIDNDVYYTIPSYQSPIVSGSWFTLRVPFTRQTTTPPQVYIALWGNGPTSTAYIDSVVLTEITPTLIDRWGFKRTTAISTNMNLTETAAMQIGDTFLAAHRDTPLKGKLVVPGSGLAKHAPSGRGILAAELLTMTSELVRMGHLIDPNTGKVGRIGRIANVTYDAASDTAEIDIDSSSTNFEALLARMQIVVGQIR